MTCQSPKCSLSPGFSHGLFSKEKKLKQYHGVIVYFYIFSMILNQRAILPQAQGKRSILYKCSFTRSTHELDPKVLVSHTLSPLHLFFEMEDYV